MKVELATPADLIELGNTLSQPNKIEKITLVTRCPKELRGTLSAICKSMSVIRLVIFYEGPLPARNVMIESFADLEKQQAPLKAFQWFSKQPNNTPLQIDQRIFTSLLASQLLEQVHFSVPQGDHFTSVIINNPEQLVNSIKNHRSLKCLSLAGINGSEFINSILTGVDQNKIIEELRLERIDLRNCRKALESVANNNKTLRGVSVNGCQLELQTVSNMLECFGQHPVLESLDFSQADIPARELQSIGACIGKLLLLNRHIKTLGTRCNLSSANIAAIKTGLDTNTSLTRLKIEAFEEVEQGGWETYVGFDISGLFRSNKGLREIVIQFPESDNDKQSQILQGIAENPLIESLTIRNSVDINELIDFIKQNPGIKDMKVNVQNPEYRNDYEFIGKLNELANEMKKNKTLLSFNFAPPLINEYGFLNNVLFRIDEVVTRNRLRSIAQPAGIAMTNRQASAYSGREDLAAMPAEINQQLYEAAINYLPLEDAKRVYNAIQPFTTLPKNQ